jgi:hypothetical protein
MRDFRTIAAWRLGLRAALGRIQLLSSGLNRALVTYGLPATIAVAAVAGIPAQAQIMCTPNPYSGTGNLSCMNSGHVDGGAEDGIDTFASANASMTNSGTVTSNGPNNDAILTESFVAGNSSTTNSGTVIVSGPNSVGIFTLASGPGDAMTTNSGAVSANGSNSSGIGTVANNGGNATMTNSGAVTVIGVGNGAIVTESITTGSAMATNTGTVSSSGAHGFGIGTFAKTGNATTINSGTVSASGSFSIGIATQALVLGNATTINSGNVSASGTGSVGVATLSANGTSTIINAGTISNPGGIAISFIKSAFDPAMLTLLPGSFIVGTIQLPGTGGTVNIDARNQNLSFNTLAGATVTSTFPSVVSGNRIATVDPTSFATASTALADFTRSVSAIVPDFGDRSASGSTGVVAFASPEGSSRVADAFASLPGLSAYNSEQIAFKSPTAVYADGTAVWGRGFGGQHIQLADGTLLRNTSTWYGGAMGIDKLVRPDLRLGAFIGAGSTHNSIDLNSGSTDSNIVFGGAYARYTVGSLFLNVALQAGSLSSTTLRNINNNLSAGGLEVASAGYGGWYISPEVTLGQQLALGRLFDSHYSVTPSVQVRDLYASFGGYSETGTTANLAVGNRDTQGLEERAQIKLTRITQISPTSQLSINLTGGVIGDQRIGTDAVDAILLAQPIAFTAPGATNVWGGLGELGLEWQMRDVSVFAAASYIAWQNSGSIVSGRGGIRVGF